MSFLFNIKIIFNIFYIIIIINKIGVKITYQLIIH
jgi:hypothetical protein